MLIPERHYVLEGDANHRLVVRPARDTRGHSSEGEASGAVPFSPGGGPNATTSHARLCRNLEARSAARDETTAK